MALPAASQNRASIFPLCVIPATAADGIIVSVGALIWLIPATLASAAGDGKMMRKLASGVVPIPFGVAVFVTAVFSGTTGPSLNIQGLEDVVPAKTTVRDFPLRPIDAPKVELALSPAASVQDQPMLPDQPAILANAPDQPAILPEQPAILASVQDRPAILPDQLARVQGQPARVRDEPASVPNPPPPQMAEIVPLPPPRPPSVPLSRPRHQSERRQAQVEPQSFFDFFTNRAR
jgi:hypothetical protein